MLNALLGPVNTNLWNRRRRVERLIPMLNWGCGAPGGNVKKPSMKNLRCAMWPPLALVAITVAFQVPAKPAPPQGLLVNGVSRPLAIDPDPARFTWRSVAAKHGETQSAYQILVSSSAHRLAAGTADWWDSGKVDSAASASVAYAGKALPPATRFWWKVRTWDQAGEPSATQ